MSTSISILIHLSIKNVELYKEDKYKSIANF